MREEEFVLLMVVVLSGIGILLAVILGPIGKAMARRIGGRTGPDPAQQAMLEDLHARVDDLGDLRREVSELQDRLDFAERVLTRGGGEANAAPPGRLGEGAR